MQVRRRCIGPNASACMKGKHTICYFCLHRRLPLILGGAAAGTNFLIRSNAFEECGWSPEYTLTEDYALGMELTKRRWKCRYVEEYLAIGEAPEEVRNCFQQRSRWAKVRRAPFLIATHPKDNVLVVALISVACYARRRYQYWHLYDCCVSLELMSLCTDKSASEAIHHAQTGPHLLGSNCTGTQPSLHSGI